MSYTRTTNFITAGSARRSAAMNAELDKIAAAFGGFDDSIADVLAALALKADIASPALTGVPTAPTASVGTNTAQLATTAYVITAIGASGSLLPPMAGNAGKYLYTDATSASWQALPYVPSIGTGGYQAVTADVTLGTTARFIDVTATTVGLELTLPDATTLEDGDGYLLNFNVLAADTTQGVRNDSGELIYTNDAADPSVALVLTSNADSDGDWRTLSLGGVGIRDLPSTPVIQGEQTTFVSGSTGAASIALGSDKFLQVCHSSGNLRAYVVSASGVALSKGAEATASEATAPVWSRLVAVTGGYVYLYLKSFSSGAIKALGVTVSGTTASVGSVATLIATATSTVADAIHFAASGATAVVAARTSATTIEAAACSLTGTTVNVGTAVTAIAGTSMASSKTQVRVVCYDTDKFLVASSTDDGGAGVLFAATLSNSSLTLTAGSLATDATADYGDLAMAVTSTTAVLILHRESGGALFGRVAGISGSTVTLPAETNLQSMSCTQGGLDVVALSTTLFAVAVSGASGTGIGIHAVNVAGTVVTIGASLTTITGNAQLPGGSYDGTYVWFPVSGLCAVTSSSVASIISAANLTGTDAYAYRLSYLKSYAFFHDGVGRGEIARYGGVT